MNTPALSREPIGLRVLIRALRPDDHEPFLLWRADPEPEAEALIEVGEAEDRALLWASLLRWSEAQSVTAALATGGWTATLHGVRAIVLARAVSILCPPSPTTGWTLTVAGLTLRAVPETPGQDEQSLARMLAFLDA
jgi:hypothetical protein